MTDDPTLPPGFASPETLAGVGAAPAAVGAGATVADRPAARPSGPAPVTTTLPGTNTTIPGTPTGRRRRKGRRVRRVVRRIDLWSVLKLSLVVYTCLYAAVMATLAALWGLAYSSGSIDKLQSFMSDVGLENYHFYGDRMFRACAAIGAVGVLTGTVVTVLATALINVISEVTGGIRLVVIEEDVQI